MATIINIEPTINNFKKELVNYIVKEIQGQGHSLTGSFEQNIEATDEINETDITIKVAVPFYGKYLNSGVSSSKIPYNPGSGAKKSAYIDALVEYAKVRFNLDGKEAKSAAFAIAQTHKKHGMPSPGSYRYASNTRRTEWVDNVLAEADNAINKFVSTIVDEYVDFSIINNYGYGTNSINKT